MKYSVAVIPGDGVGPVVVEAALKVLDALSKLFSIEIDFKFLEAGDMTKKQSGAALPDLTFKEVRDTHACLKGPIGETAREVVLPLRQKLDLYANIRPAKSLANIPSAIGGVDLVVVRENTEGLYKGIEDETSEYSFSVRVITKRCSSRIAKVAYETALQRRRKVTIVHKANVLRSCELFRGSCLEVARGFPQVETEEMYVDNAAYQLVKDPTRFDVIVTTNLFGDILSDEAAGVVGGLGLCPSANIGDQYGLFEPVHGSAPNIDATKANPIATILSAKMMLEWFSKKYQDLNLVEASKILESSVLDLLMKGDALTFDLGGKAGATDVAEALVRRIGGSKKPYHIK